MDRHVGPGCERAEREQVAVAHPYADRALPRGRHDGPDRPESARWSPDGAEAAEGEVGHRARRVIDGACDAEATGVRQVGITPGPVRPRNRIGPRGRSEELLEKIEHSAPLRGMHQARADRDAAEPQDQPRRGGADHLPPRSPGTGEHSPLREERHVSFDPGPSALPTRRSCGRSNRDLTERYEARQVRKTTDDSTSRSLGGRETDGAPTRSPRTEASKQTGSPRQVPRAFARAPLALTPIAEGRSGRGRVGRMRCAPRMKKAAPEGGCRTHSAQDLEGSAAATHTILSNPDRDEARLGPRDQRADEILDAACGSTSGRRDDIREALDEGGGFSHRDSLASGSDGGTSGRIDPFRRHCRPILCNMA